MPVEEKEAADSEAPVEEKEATSEAPVEALPTEAEVDVEVCQTEEALEDLGPERLQSLNAKLTEDVSAGRFANMQEALASRGYTCNGRVE